MKTIGVVFSCARDADKLVWCNEAMERLGIEVVVICDPATANGRTLYGDGAPQACVRHMLVASVGYDAVLKVDSDTLVLSKWWESLDHIAEIEGLRNIQIHPEKPSHISGAAYLIQRSALERIDGHPLLQSGGEDRQITLAVRECGMKTNAPLYRFPYPRGLAFWYFGQPDDSRYDGAKAIVFGNSAQTPGATPEEKHRAISDAMAEYCRAHGITP